MSDLPVSPGSDEPIPGIPVGGAGGGGLGGFDLGSMLEAAQSMQAQLMEAQEQMAATEVEGVAGGGLVRITVTGGFEFRGVSISPDAVDAEDPGVLEDLVLAALRDAVSRVGELQAQAAPQMPGLGDLGGLFGG